MLPVMTGKIARRILINYRADPEIVARMIPAPLELQIVNGYAMTGICLVRLEELRPSFVPPAVGLKLLPSIAEKKPKEVWLNPGAESDELIEVAADLHLRVIVACSIVALGLSPEEFPDT